MGRKKIMVIDDEPSIVQLVDFNLRKEGYDVIKAYSADEALDLSKKNDVDLFIIDVMLPGSMDGFELCRVFKVTEKTKNKPIIFLTAKGEEFERVLGLELGADDYIPKPFSIRELVARIKAIFRRIHMAEVYSEEKPKKIVASDIEIDLEKCEVKVKGKLIELTPLEFDLLQFLAENKGKVFNREVLLDTLWGYDYYGDTRTVDVHIRRLRTKVEEDPSNPRYIITVRGKGYKFIDPGESSSN